MQKQCIKTCDTALKPHRDLPRYKYYSKETESDLKKKQTTKKQHKTTTEKTHVFMEDNCGRN